MSCCLSKALFEGFIKGPRIFPYNRIIKHNIDLLHIDILAPYKGMIAILKTYAKDIWKKDVEIEFLATWKKKFYDDNFEDLHREGFLKLVEMIKDKEKHTIIDKIRITANLSKCLIFEYHPLTKIIDVNLDFLLHVANETSRAEGQYTEYLRNLLELKLDLQQGAS